MRALVIDDSKAMRHILADLLGEMGFEVHEAEDGHDAMERLKQVGMVELALVDWNMPVMNGLEFVRAIRSDPVHSDMMMMMVTTETTRERVVQALSAGVDEYLMKPVTKEMLAEKLQILGIAAS